MDVSTGTDDMLLRQAQSDDMLLDQTQRQIFMRLLPVIVLTAFLCAVGIIGNILAMVFYTTKCKQTTTVTLIIFLAVVDLVVSILIVPKLLEMIVNVEYTQRFLCKTTQFLSLWAVASSCFILGMISIDRYRKICKPFAKQITASLVKCIITGILIFTLALSVRNVVNYDIVSVQITSLNINMTVTGLYCTVTDNPEYKFIVSGFFALDFLLILTVWLTMIVTYSNSVLTILRRHVKRKWKSKISHRNNSQNTGSSGKYRNSVYPRDDDGKSSFGSSDWSSCNESRDDYPESSFGNGGEQIESAANETIRPTLICELNEGDFPVGSIPRRNEVQKPKRKDLRVKFAAIKNPLERNLTIMMCAASVIFILCFTPFFVIRVLMRIVFNVGIEFELRTGIQFALKLPFLNSVFNPIIYCIFNPKFRQYIKSTIFRC